MLSPTGAIYTANVRQDMLTGTDGGMYAVRSANADGNTEDTDME